MNLIERIVGTAPVENKGRQAIFRAEDVDLDAALDSIRSAKLERARKAFAVLRPLVRKLAAGGKLDAKELRELDGLLAGGLLTESNLAEAVKAVKYFEYALQQCVRHVIKSNAAKAAAKGAAERIKKLEQDIQTERKNIINEHYACTASGGSIAELTRFAAEHRELFEDVDVRAIIDRHVAQETSR